MLLLFTHHSAINATTLALFDAGIPCKDYVVSCTAGHLDKCPLLDLNYEEESSGGPMVTVSMAPSTGVILTTEMISKMSIDAFEETMKLSQDGCQQIYVRNFSLLCPILFLLLNDL